MIRVLLATTNIFASLVFGALAMGFVWYFSPDTIQTLFQTASSMKGWLVSRGLSSSYNNFLWFLIEEKQLVFMGFVMTTRIVLAVIVSILMKLLGRE
ncbi:MAG: hypothetical protein R3D27_14905 [Hyphomicrobiaceae bacterium]